MQNRYAASLLGFKGTDPLSPILTWRMTTTHFPALTDDEARIKAMQACKTVWKESDGFVEHYVSIIKIPEKTNQ